METYQTIMVIDSLLKSEEIDAIIEKILRIINNNGGKVTNVDRWEKKRLAYEIKKRQYGYYVEIDFEAPENLVKILERDYRLDENILRYLTVNLDSKAIAYLDRQKSKEKMPADKEIPEIPELIPELIDDLEAIEDENEDREHAATEESEPLS